MKKAELKQEIEKKLEEFGCPHCQDNWEWGYGKNGTKRELEDFLEFIIAKGPWLPEQEELENIKK